ncbi:MAG: aspartate aminotransferase family protein [Thiotrichales bacterium]|nr:aspartate aminotransferase family protein [Thiotrichales bacterium]
MSYLMGNYSPGTVAFTRGEGACLYDADGNQYLDALSGIAVCGLGHAHPGVSAAIAEQASCLLHTSNLYRIPLQETLAGELVNRAGMEKVFFCNSGAEANEAAIKIARLHGHGKNLDDPCIVVMQGSFHGRTMATLTATGNAKVQQGFAPLLSGFIRVPYDDIDAIRALAADNKNICAVLLEPIQGEGGVVVPAAGYLSAIRKICNDNGWLMMLDEVQTGMCRTGKWFACQHEDVVPDVMTLAKALGNGVPIGACLAQGPASNLMQPGSHGSTFGGNPLAARAALTVIKIMDEIGAAQRAEQSGQWLMEKLTERLGKLDGVRQIRGRGMMIGIELGQDCAELVQQAQDQRLLINVTAGNVIRLLPPLIMDETQLRQLVDILSPLIENFLQQGAA